MNVELIAKGFMVLVTLAAGVFVTWLWLLELRDFLAKLLRRP